MLPINDTLVEMILTYLTSQIELKPRKKTINGGANLMNNLT